MDDSTVFWSIIFPTFLPFILILAIFLIWWIIRWRERRKWKPIAARVLRIEAIDTPDSDGVLEPRQYKLDLVFQWQGTDWYRSWMFPRTYDLPKAGDMLQLRYHPKKEDFQLTMSRDEKRRIRRLRLYLLLIILIPPIFISLIFSPIRQEFTLSAKSPWWLFSVLLLVMLYVRRVGGARRLRRKIEQGELRPITARVQGFRKDSEGDAHAFCTVRVNGQEKEITLFDSSKKHYEVGQQVTLYLDPENGQICTYPDVHSRSWMILGILALTFVAFQLYCWCFV